MSNLVVFLLYVVKTRIRVRVCTRSVCEACTHAELQLDIALEGLKRGLEGCKTSKVYPCVLQPL